MAGEYDLNLSDGTIHATLYPLEVNGPANLSTPRRIRAINIGAGTFELHGDVTARFVAGFQFTVQGTGGGLSDGSYTVSPAGSSEAADVTTIPVTTAIPSDALPLGEIQYTNMDPNTVLSLPGRGTVNYGEYLIDSLVHLVENFAAEDSPDTNPNLGLAPYGNPLTGQLWYNTTVGEEGLLFYKNDAEYTGWTRDRDLDTGTLRFKDPENTIVPNTDMLISGSDPLFPDVGLTIRTTDDPLTSHSILRVLSEGGSERLRVEHNGSTSTTNNLEVLATPSTGNESFIDGTLAIGGHPSGNVARATTDRTLTVQGNGIAVNSDLTNDATLELNAPAGMSPNLTFNVAGTGILDGDISVNGGPLEINSTTTNDTVMVMGGGNVGIGTITTSAKLDVVGTSEFNGSVSIVNSTATFSNGFGLQSTAGAQLNTNGSGSTWQTTPASNSDASFIANDFVGTPILTVDPLSGTHVSQNNFYVDTDTLSVDAFNDRVGVNVAPTSSFTVGGVDIDMTVNSDIDIVSLSGQISLNSAYVEVSGPTRFDSPVGINNFPPSSPVWLEVTGDIQANSQIRGSDQTVLSPTFTFTDHLNAGMCYDTATDSILFSTLGVERLRLHDDGPTFAGDMTIDGDIDIIGFSPDLRINASDGGDAKFVMGDNLHLATREGLEIVYDSGDDAAYISLFAGYNDTTQIAIKDGLINAGVNGQPVVVPTDPADLANKEYVDNSPGPTNYFINGAFDHWQRADTQTTVGMDSTDRWEHSDSSVTKTVTKRSFTPGQTAVPNVPYYAETNVTFSAGASTIGLIEYPFDGVETLNGETVTISYYAKADASKNMSVGFVHRFGAGGSTAVYGGGVVANLTTSWQRFTATITIPSVSGKTIGAGSTLKILFYYTAGSTYNIFFDNGAAGSPGIQTGTFDIACVQLEKGTIATPYTRRRPEDEFRLCQRYYQKHDVIALNTDASHNAYLFPTEMRSSPSMTLTIASGAGASFTADTSGFRQTSINNVESAVTVEFDAEVV